MFIILFLTTILFFVLYKLYNKPDIDRCLFWYLLFSAILWVVLPSIITLFNDRNKQIILISEDIFIRYSAYEYIYYIMLYSLLFFYPKTKTFYRGKYIPNTKTSLNVLWYLFSISLVLNSVLLIYSGYSYYDLNNVAIKSQQTTNIFSIFANFGMCLYFTIFFYYKDSISKVKYWSTWLLLILNISVQVMHGSRIQIIFLMFIFTFLFFERTNTTKRKLITLSILIAIIYLSSIIIPTIAQIRNKGSYDISDVKNASSSLDNNQSAFIVQLMIKLNSINTGSVLVEMSSEKAYYKPYLNSLLSPIPSIIYPTRPIAGSIDGTINGLPSRRVASLITGDSSIQNMGVSTSAMALWHGGFPFYLFNLLISFFWFRYINTLFNTDHFFARLLGFYFTIIGLFILPTADIMIKELLKQPMFYLLFMVLTTFFWQFGIGTSKEPVVLKQKKL